MSGDGYNRRAEDPALSQIAQKLGDIQKWRGRVDRDLAANTRLTKQIAKDTARMRGLLVAGDRTANVLCTAAQVWRFCIRYVAIPLACVVAFVQWLTHSFQVPDWFRQFIGFFF